MRLATIFLTLITSCPTASTITASEPLRPDSLLEWLRIIDSDDFSLLCATNQHGYYFAVKLDTDGDILFCDYNHSDNSKDNPRQFSLSVLDPDGNDLHEIASKKRSPNPIKKTYSTNSSIGPIKTSSSVTIAYSAGTIYALRERRQKTIRIRYTEQLKSGTKILFDQLVHLPQNAG